MSKEFTRKSLNYANVTDDYTRELVDAGATSFFCSNVEERIPEFDKAPCEVKIQGNHNAFIILGRDRNSNWISGHGGKGSLQCGMIDLVAGRGQLTIAQNKKKNADPLEGVEFVGPMFHSDAARIYITQKAEDIDKYFGLKPSGGPAPSNKSAVALKADQMRIIAREKVRIYAGRGNFEGFDPNVGETNSIGGRLRGQVIELQVGNQELHPMVLGHKLVEYLKKKNKKERTILKTMFNIHMNLMTLNTIVSILPGAAVGIVPMMSQTIADSGDTITQVINTYLDEINALDSDLIPGKNHILSNTVFTT